MFDGEMICRSKKGHGSNFVFIMAIDENIDTFKDNLELDRILNPVYKEYDKIEIDIKKTYCQDNENSLIHKKTFDQLSLNQ